MSAFVPPSSPAKTKDASSASGAKRKGPEEEEDAGGAKKAKTDLKATHGSTDFTVTARELDSTETDVCCMCFHESPIGVRKKEDWDTWPDGKSKSFSFGLTQFIATNKHCYVAPCVGTLTEVELFLLYVTLLRTEGALPPYQVTHSFSIPCTDDLYFVFFTKMDVKEPGAYVLQRRLVKFKKPNAVHTSVVLNAAMNDYVKAIQRFATDAKAATAAAEAAIKFGGEEQWHSVVNVFD